MKVKTLIEKADLKINSENIKFNEDMKKYTSFKIGGPAECLIKINNIEELKKVLEFSKQNNITTTILGNGSNVLVSDEGIQGIVLIVRIDNIDIKKDEDVTIVIGSGYKMSKLAQVLLQNQITGFEQLSGIPGTIGGAVKMNAGAHGKEMKDIVKSVKCIDYEGNEKELSNKECQFEYRESIFKQKKYIITEVTLILQKGIKEKIKEKMDEYSSYRKEKQPIEYPSAGSTFKRGKDFITAKLIDDVGLKGYSIGDAQVSTKHSGFIINKGNAKAEDVIKLIEYVQKEIYEKCGKKIELEIEIIGKK